MQSCSKLSIKAVKSVNITDSINLITYLGNFSYCSSVYITYFAQTFSATRLDFQALKELHEVKYFTRLSKIRQSFKNPYGLLITECSVNYRC